MPVNVLVWDEELINSVVPVQFGSGITYAIKNLKLHDLIESFIQCYIFKFKTYRPGRFPGAHPVTILNRESQKLLGDKLISEKLDGTRYLLVALKFITSNQEIPQYIVLLMNRATDMYILPNLSIPVELAPCALEAEMIKQKTGCEWHLLIFNLVMTKGKRVNRFRYQERLKMCDDFLARTQMLPDKGSPINKIIRKKQFLPHQIALVYERAKSGEYACDGFIVTDNYYEGVLHGSDYNSFKVKDIHTQDVMVGLSTSGRDDFLTIYALGSNKSNDPAEEKEKHVPYQQQKLKRFFKHYRDTDNPVTIQDSDTWKGKIYECEWNKKTEEFYAIKARLDKRHANPLSILKKTQESIREGSMNVEEVRTFVSNYYQQQREMHLQRLTNTNQPQSHMETSLVDKRAHIPNYCQLLYQYSNWREPFMKNRDEFFEEWASLELSYQHLLPNKIPTKEKVLDTLKINVEKLSVIRLTDPMSRYYDFQKDDVVMVTDGEDETRNFFAVGVAK